MQLTERNADALCKRDKKRYEWLQIANGLMEIVFGRMWRLFPFLSSPQHAKQRPAGLRNFGNTCYLNSVLQSFASLPSFREYVREVSSSRMQLTSTLQAVAHALRESSPMEGWLTNTSSKVHEVIRHLTKYNCTFGDFEQQDAQECYQALTNMLSSELRRVHNSHMQAPLLRQLDNPPSTTVLPIVMHAYAKHLFVPMTAYQRKTLSIALPYSSRDSAAVVCPPPHTPFEGWLSSEMICMECRQPRPQKTLPFTSISLSLALSPPDAPSIKGGDLPFSQSLNAVTHVHTAGAPTTKYTLFGCLDKYLEPEILHDVECNHCTVEYRKQQLQRLLHTWTAVDGFESEVSNIRQQLRNLDAVDVTAQNFQDQFDSIHRTVAMKHLIIRRLPRILCFHVSRRVYNEHTGHLVKIKTHVAFPVRLDMKEYLSNYSKAKSDASSPRSTSTTDESFGQYELCAVVVHHGSSDGGHYTTYAAIKNHSGKTERWVHCNDKEVTSVSVNEVLKCEAYLLFYDSIEVDPISEDKAESSI